MLLLDYTASTMSLASSLLAKHPCLLKVEARIERNKKHASKIWYYGIAAAELPQVLPTAAAALSAPLRESQIAKHYRRLA